MGDGARLDMLAVEVFAWSPHLETACEICLCEAERGRRVGFVFLDVDNIDEYPGVTPIARWIHRLLRGARRAKVRMIEEVLRSHGVTVIPVDGRNAPAARLPGAGAGFESAATLRGYRHEHAALGLGVLSSMTFHLRDAEPDVASHREMVDRLLAASIDAYGQARRVIGEWRPEEVLVFNGRFACTKGVVEAARAEGVRVLYHEVGGSQDRYYFSDRAVHSSDAARERLRDGWERAGEDREAIAHRYFAPRRSGARLLEGRFSNPQQRGRSLPETGRRRIVYYASSVDEYAAVEDGLDEGLFASQRAAVEWLVAWVRSRPDVELILRIHPRMTNLSPPERRWWMSLDGGNVTTLPAEHPADSYALAAGADRVVCFHSSLGPEATWLGTVSILVGDASYRGLDCVYEPRSIEELEACLLDGDLPPKPAARCLPFGYHQMTKGTPFRFYRPASFREGSFFGTPVPTKPPLPVRVVARILSSLDRGLLVVRRRLAAWKP